MMMRHPIDGRCHFSEIKKHAQSPAHVKLACTVPLEISRPMLIGGIADSLVFEHGKSHAIYPGRRIGKEWEAFKAANPDRYLCIQSEYDDAEGAALAVLADPVAREVLAGCHTQQVMQWEAYGLPCAAGIKGQRGGFDAYHPEHLYLADLKVTACTEPEQLSRHVLNMNWHTQLAWYQYGARMLGISIQECKLIAVEAQPPHNVTVLRIPESWLQHGEKLLTMWTDKHRACELADAWPGYVQSEIDAIDPGWMSEHVELEGLDDADS